MNIIKLCGGIGNQLFQYAFGRVQMANGIDVRYDVSWFKKYEEIRPYRLGKFNINLKLGPFLKQKTIIEGGCDLDLLKVDNCNFSGYWQYLAYYDQSGILPTLRNEFYVREEFYTSDYLNLRKQIIEVPSVSIHVRRGDYIGADPTLFQIQPLSYYFKALSHVKGNLFIFSDDLPWCKEYFKEDYFSRQITFVGLVDYLDFDLMRLCESNIICSSSFSWWAAYLNDNPKKIVVAPERWIVGAINEPRYNNKIHYPKSWIKI